MINPLFKLRAMYIEYVLPKPFCIDCKETMEFKGWVSMIADVSGKASKGSQRVYRCDEDSYEVWIKTDGSYSTLHIEEE